MDLQSELHKVPLFDNLELLAHQIVEGFVSGIHKSPFHGFSAEFAEHAIYNPGESTKHIDWKLFAKTDRLYTKKYEEETNLRCHLILDTSSSMYYPEVKKLSINHLNKIGFGALAIASLMRLLQKQHDAVGLSLYSDTYHFYAPEKRGERHIRRLYAKINDVICAESKRRNTKTYTYLHQIAEKIPRRSLIFLFSDMFQSEAEEIQLFEALRHLKYNKHAVVLFHLMDYKRELHFDFENTPKRFVDVETGMHIDLYADAIKDAYSQKVKQYQNTLQLKCGQYKIKYVGVDINTNFYKVLTAFMVARQKFG